MTAPLITVHVQRVLRGAFGADEAGWQRFLAAEQRCHERNLARPGRPAPAVRWTPWRDGVDHLGPSFVCEAFPAERA